MKKIKVLVVDDSAVTRKLITEALQKSKQIEVVATAIDPFIAVDKIKRFNPDVLTLDIQMPRMDGLTFLSKLMIAHPMPVVMVSAFTEAGARETIRALELGAVDFVLKPKLDDADAWDEFANEIIEKIIAASALEINRKLRTPNNVQGGREAFQKFDADAVLPKKNVLLHKGSELVIAIGASTGGTEAITEILTNLPEDVPGIAIVQHMPEKFTKAFAERLNGLAKIFIKEAEHGDKVVRGMALIAPGNRHMILRFDGEGYFVEIIDGPPVNRHRPSVDVLFRSVALNAGKKAVGILLTGMGCDGAQGLLEMKEAGAHTIAQDERSSVVFGMPREAIKLNAAKEVKNLQQIAAYICSLK
ncbi:MAG: chemotaxis response regulator protein-glutamate methylesterase [Spirochaetes bacterium]|nr:chemotaxis response regulator protein-glutamate methylesterase [Spirochaetota bacterium]